MLTFTNYLIVILILLVVLLGFIYTTDYFEINNLFRQNLQTTEITETTEATEATETEISILPSPLTNNYDSFLIDNNYATLDSENINNALFINSDEYQITENANNAITNALKNI